MRFGCLVTLALVACGALQAQRATVTQAAVNLRAEPSAQSAAEAVLHKGDVLAVLDATPERGFLQVKTQDGKDGWVSVRAIKIVQSPSSANPAVDPESPAANGPVTCDETLWSHVYNPARLIIKTQCLAVTGTIVDATNGKESDGVRHEEDGDTHGWLKVDPPFEDLLNPGNLSNEGGNLVFEIVCRFPVKQTDAVKACVSFQNAVKIPKVGSHVQIVGSYVRDTNHAQWMEIHPVTSITVIP
jgi:flagellar basal body rod protein FlgC